MVLTVTLNPAIDKTVYVESFEEGKLNRVKASRLDPGGKGINVSKALFSYDIAQIATGILAGMNGRHLLSLLEKYSFSKEFLMVSGETRVNLKIVDMKTHRVTEINESGPKISENDINEFFKILRQYLAKSDLLVLSGSIPEGVPTDFYSECIKQAASMNVRSILDADGEVLKLGCRALPYAIKPNIHEFEYLTGKSFANYRELRDGIRAVHETGIELVIVSLGKEGCIISCKNKAYRALPLSIKEKSTVGAGDSMVAALAYCIKNNIPLEETARIVTAAGCLTAALDGSDMSEWKDIKNAYKDVYIEEI